METRSKNVGEVAVNSFGACATKTPAPLFIAPPGFESICGWVAGGGAKRSPQRRKIPHKSLGAALRSDPSHPTALPVRATNDEIFCFLRKFSEREASNSLPRRGFIPKPRVSGAAAPPWVKGSKKTYPKGVGLIRCATPLGRYDTSTQFPGCAAAPRPWALEYNAFGVKTRP